VCRTGSSKIGKQGRDLEREIAPLLLRVQGQSYNKTCRNANLKGEVAMSASSEEKWIDRWWPLFLILFGVLFVTVLVSFAPVV
jgi:hypothetical protein